MENEVPIKPKPIDVNQEAADIKRLIQAGKNNDDLITTAAGVRRASQLGKKTGLNITDPTVSILLGLDKLPQEDID